MSSTDEGHAGVAPTRCSEALAELEHLLEPHLWVTDLAWEGEAAGHGG